MSTIAFLNIAVHGRVHPTLPLVAELVRRGHTVTDHKSPAFRAEIEAAGLVAPLIFTAVLAFPLLGPFLHLLLFIAVGAGLAQSDRRTA
jgi:hypothetical protein